MDFYKALVVLLALSSASSFDFRTCTEECSLFPESQVCRPNDNTTDQCPTLRPLFEQTTFPPPITKDCYTMLWTLSAATDSDFILGRIKSSQCKDWLTEFIKVTTLHFQDHYDILQALADTLGIEGPLPRDNYDGLPDGTTKPKHSVYDRLALPSHLSQDFTRGIVSFLSRQFPVDFMDFMDSHFLAEGFYQFPHPHPDLEMRPDDSFQSYANRSYQVLSTGIPEPYNGHSYPAFRTQVVTTMQSFQSQLQALLDQPTIPLGDYNFTSEIQQLLTRTFTLERRVQNQETNYELDKREFQTTATVFRESITNLDNSIFNQHLKLIGFDSQLKQVTTRTEILERDQSKLMERLSLNISLPQLTTPKIQDLLPGAPESIVSWATFLMGLYESERFCMAPCSGTSAALPSDITLTHVQSRKPYQRFTDALQDWGGAAALFIGMVATIAGIAKTLYSIYRKHIKIEKRKEEAFYKVQNFLRGEGSLHTFNADIYFPASSKKQVEARVPNALCTAINVMFRGSSEQTIGVCGTGIKPYFDPTPEFCVRMGNMALNRDEAHTILSRLPDGIKPGQQVAKLSWVIDPEQDVEKQQEMINTLHLDDIVSYLFFMFGNPEELPFEQGDITRPVADPKFFPFNEDNNFRPMAIFITHNSQVLAHTSLPEIFTKYPATGLAGPFTGMLARGMEHGFVCNCERCDPIRSLCTTAHVIDRSVRRFIKKGSGEDATSAHIRRLIEQTSDKKRAAREAPQMTGLMGRRIKKEKDNNTPYKTMTDKQCYKEYCKFFQDFKAFVTPSQAIGTEENPFVVKLVNNTIMVETATKPTPRPTPVFNKLTFEQELAKLTGSQETII